MQAKTAPRAYVESLFDAYAAKFKHSVVSEFEYKTPKLWYGLMNYNSPVKR